MRPMEVSMTTVGPLGRIIAAAVAWGASGRASAGWAGAVVECCAGAEPATTAVRAERRSACVSFMPILRVNHAAGGLPAAGGEHVWYTHDASGDSACFPAHGNGRVHDLLLWDFSFATCGPGRERSPICRQAGWRRRTSRWRQGGGRQDC